MNTEDYINLGEKYLIHTYNRFPIVLEKGEGVYLYDTDGKKYLDFASGIAVCSLGYHHKEYTETLKNQMDFLMHTSNLYYNIPSVTAAEKVVKATGLSKCFFTNSGAESVEGALKVARRYAYDKYGAGEHEVIAMEHSFHGRTFGALALTGTEAYRTPFEPMIPGVKYARFNDFDSVKALVNDRTRAIILEPIQGEGGIYPATEEFIRNIRALCDERDILMICDEIQCGMGRTGEMFAYQRYGILPDIVTCAKALGCGVAVGAFVCGEKCCDCLVPGDHGTTYGGNPLATAAVNIVLDIFKKEHIVEHVREVSVYLERKLDEIVCESPNVVQRRGVGLIQGLVLATPVKDTIRRARENGLLLISAGNNVLRIVPPLVITNRHIDEMITILREST